MCTVSVPHANVSVAGTARGWSVRATPATLCRVTMWSFLVALVTSTSADPDLWGHLRFGLDMLASKAVLAVDHYSFTSDRVWINHEWLAELLMGIGYTSLGSLGLNLLKMAVIAVVGGIGFTIARQERARPIARDVYVGLMLFATYSRTQVIRPQMFSVAIFTAMLFALRETDRGRRRALGCIPLLFAVWVNLHGAWIVGLAALGVWMLGEAWTRRSVSRLLALAAVGGLVLLATLLNPYGFGLWRFLAETVGLDRPDITDWKPLLQLPPGILVIESVLPLIAIASLLTGRAWRRVPVRDVAVLALLCVATYRVGRVDAFFEVAIGILLADPIIAFLNGVAAKIGGLFNKPSIAVGVMAGLIATYVLAAGVPRLGVIDVSGPWIPDRTAAAFLREHSPDARVLTWFDWGEYALWQLSPAGIRVSMDGRRETVYSARVIHDHERFYRGADDSLDYPDRIGANYVWLPSRFPVIAPLKRRGWTAVLDTGYSVVLRRGDEAMPAAPIASAIGAIFPWP